MSNWGYVTIAFTAVWGVLALYALVLARRVTQGEIANRVLRGADDEAREAEGEETRCDTPPAP